MTAGSEASPQEPAVTATASAGVAEAMRRVLEAEREAAGDVERCRAECRTALEAARAQATQIAARGEAIAQAIHGRIERVADLRAARRRQALAVESAEPDAERVAAAVARLVDRLCGATK